MPDLRPPTAGILVRGARQRRLLASALALACLVAAGQAAEVTNPRADAYIADDGLRALMDWVTFRLTFDGRDLVPDMAAGDPTFTQRGSPQFAAGVKGQALLAGGESGSAIYLRELNAPLETRGGISVWLCPLEWTHVNGGNTEFLMTANSSFYLQRQGPMHNAEGVMTRQEALQFLMLSEVTGNNCLAFGTDGWPNGQWRLLVANWSWPTMSFSLDGGEFQSVSVKQNPTAANFGAIAVGSSGGEKTLVDELTIYRRPLTLDEVRHLYEVLKPLATEGQR
jgi:Concanavalin A-like lectin/glucanases superfamily